LTIEIEEREAEKMRKREKKHTGLWENLTMGPKITVATPTTSTPFTFTRPTTQWRVGGCVDTPSQTTTTSNNTPRTNNTHENAIRLAPKMERV
jgi:hypothetical protein